MKTKRFKIFMKNIKTGWISKLSFAKMVMIEYWTHFMKMGMDMDANSQVAKPLNIWPIWMSCCSWLVSSLSWKWSIISSFFQGNDNFICNFVSLIKICQALLYSMFVNLVTKFLVEMFHSHHGLLDYVHESNTLEWIPMLEFFLEHLKVCQFFYYDTNLILRFGSHGNLLWTFIHVKPSHGWYWVHIITCKGHGPLPYSLCFFKLIFWIY